MYLFHNATRDSFIVRDSEGHDLRVPGITIMDAEGRTYRIPANEPWEVPEIRGTDCNGTNAYAPFVIPAQKSAKIFCDEGVRFGLVPVPEIRTANGIRFDIDRARTHSERVRKTFEDAVLERYVKGAKEDELAKVPVKPPSPAIQIILDARGLDLKRDFGLSPVGYRVSEAAAQRDAVIADLAQRNTTLERELGEMKDMLMDFLKDREKESRRSKSEK